MIDRYYLFYVFKQILLFETPSFRHCIQFYIQIYQKHLSFWLIFIQNIEIEVFAMLVSNNNCISFVTLS
jgi:hypothetical protein